MNNPFLLVAKSEITSTTASVDLTFDSGYENYYLSFSNIVGDTNQTRLRGQAKVGGVLQTSTYSQANVYFNLNSGNYSNSGENYNSNASWLFRTDVTAFTGVTGASLNGEVFIHHSQDNDRYTLCNGHSASMDGRTGEMRWQTIGSVFESDSVLSDLTLSMDSGNIESGTFRLYAIVNS